MINLLLGVITRIFSNSYLNVFQKILTKNGEFPSVINFYTYLGLTIIGFLICPNPIFTKAIMFNFFIMGILGAVGNYFIIKALSCGELSSLAPINSYKPIVALLVSFLLLKEVPSLLAIFGIMLIIFGTLILGNNILYNKSTLYRGLALVFSGIEAVFIKKIILLSGVSAAFLYWALASFIFTILFLFISKHDLKIKKRNIKYQVILILFVALMQYSTNYVFARMNVAYALALFQLSTLVSVFLGVNVFKEEGLAKKVIASTIMLIGAVAIIIRQFI